MKRGMVQFLKRWIITTFAVLVVAWIMPGVNYDTARDLFAASLLLGVLNAFIKPVLMLIALPLVIWTLGAFILFINAGVFYFVGQIVPGFHVTSFWAAFWAGVLVSIISLIVNLFLGGGQSRLEVRWRGRGGPRGPGGPTSGPATGADKGPVIDV